ncbi:hypothetical protein VT84_18935 [Gemmata sp. SH-PL17]|nr:hypothetical protein VT84_18935 [Gemmata sp. SH-PL17]
MTTGIADPSLQSVRALTAGRWARGESDQELLDRFVCQHDEAAFALLKRHGHMLIFPENLTGKSGRRFSGVSPLTKTCGIREAVAMGPGRKRALPAWNEGEIGVCFLTSAPV